MAGKAPTDRDRAEAVSRLLSGLVRGDDLFELAAAIEHLHPRHSTFPGEVYLRVCGEALDLAGVAGDNPIAYEGLLDEQLAEHSFRGRANRKIQFAVLAGAAARGGIEPDLLDEVVQWQSDTLVVRIGGRRRRDPRLRRAGRPIRAGLHRAARGTDHHHLIGADAARIGAHLDPLDTVPR